MSGLLQEDVVRVEGARRLGVWGKSVGVHLGWYGGHRIGAQGGRRWERAGVGTGERESA